VSAAFVSDPILQTWIKHSAAGMNWEALARSNRARVSGFRRHNAAFS